MTPPVIPQKSPRFGKPQEGGRVDLDESLAGIAASGDRKRTLEALRDRLALQIDLTESARDVAALSSRLVEVLNELKSLSESNEGEETPLARVLNIVSKTKADAPARSQVKSRR